MDTSSIIEQRNRSWVKKPEIPGWIKRDNRLEQVDLDQFFTNAATAEHYYAKAVEYLQSENVAAEDCLFIEPSAGDGSFYRLLPPDRRIGLDLCPLGDGIVQQDFLDFSPPDTDKKLVLIGNPPFGYRSWLALLFMQHAAKFADYVFFILPMAFQSEGKGSPKNRVEGLRLVHSEIVPAHSFHLPGGQDKKINALWQIWKRGDNHRESFQRFEEYLDLFTVDNRKERLCGQEKMKKADFFLQRTYYDTPPQPVEDFSQVRYVCGYGFIIKRDKERIERILRQTDWNRFSNLAAHNCRHISMYHILSALAEGGL